MVTFRDKIKYFFYFLVLVGLIIWMILEIRSGFRDVSKELKNNSQKQEDIITILEGTYGNIYK